MGQFAVFRTVIRQIGVKQNDRLSSAHVSLQHVQPAAHPDIASLDGYHYSRLNGPGVLCRIPGIGILLLPAGRVEGIFNDAVIPPNYQITVRWDAPNPMNIPPSYSITIPVNQF